MLAFLGIAAGVMVLMIAMGIMNGTQKEFTKKLFVMNYPLTVLPLEEDTVNDALITSLAKNSFPSFNLVPTTLHRSSPKMTVQYRDLWCMV